MHAQLRQLERDVAALRIRLEDVVRRGDVQPPPVLWVARIAGEALCTVEEYAGDAAATIWPITFVDATFDPYDCSELDVTERAATEYEAADLSLREFDVGDLVHVARTATDRWWILSGAGSSCDFIRFEIVTADCEDGSALVQILARPCGCSSVPDEDEYEQVTVYDKIGCLIDEGDGGVPENSPLIGRKGYAKYLEDDATGYCEWEIVTLCPPESVC